MTKVIFLWENFGPMHVDRCDAVAQSNLNVIGLELYGRSDTYEWIPESGQSFKKVTLFNEGRPRSLTLVRKLIAYRLKHGKANWFLCHYEWWEILFFAFFLRMLGDKVFTMNCSKFDDFPRNSLKEAFKRFYFLPYVGAIGSGIRSKDYFRFHGIPVNKIAVDYNTLSLERIRKMSGGMPAPQGVAFAERHFTIVARLVPKKNLHMALHAYALYKENSAQVRPLHICGSGPLEEELKALARTLGILDDVIFHGFIQTEEISKILAFTFALLLPSIEEQFGNVVIEAQAMGLPVLLSDVCGARDCLVRTGVNGFIFEPDNPQGLAWFMSSLERDEKLWTNMCIEASKFAERGDVSSFVQAVQHLVSRKS
ncbi:glycosyltransferase family 4 protein [Acinetobacter lwoffii]|uniref:glycosyltransferase family 4 protein n=1 Tax=Acinetobacter lwoffii TaxID=28090 RepID=UPI0012DCBAE4|nr:glycosyltransferase family 4 protein [Acinetobacter lwoffii]QGR74826.1 glycosyltransferase [Acinetobacter lwoffii]